MTATATPTNGNRAGRFLAGDGGLVLAGAVASFLVHLLVAGEYGWHRDELYYIACGMHLDWGYVDHPPLTPLIARAVVTLFGPSLIALRAVAALGAALTIIVAGRTAREMGGGRYAQLLTAIAVAVAPIFVIGGHLFQTVTWDQLAWAVVIWLVARLLRTGDGRLWLPIGAVFGVGLQNKHTILFLAAGLAVGLLLTPHRRWLRSPGPYAGAAIALLIWTPNLLWQAAHGWPTWAFAANSRAERAGDWPLFLPLQAPLLGFGTLALALVGAWWCFSREGQPWRLFGWLLPVVVLAVFATGGKEYYPAPAYLPAIAAGAVAAERWAGSRLRLRPALMWGVVLLALPLLPIVLPVLPVPTTVALGLHELNDDGIESVGWPELVGTVGGVYAALPFTEQPRTHVLTRNYGEAAATDLLGRPYRLPRAISGHNAYYLWGPGSSEADTYITLGFRYNELTPFFDEVVQASTVHNAFAAPNTEEGRPVFVCRRPKVPLAEVWSRFKRYG